MKTIIIALGVMLGAFVLEAQPYRPQGRLIATGTPYTHLKFRAFCEHLPNPIRSYLQGEFCETRWYLRRDGTIGH